MDKKHCSSLAKIRLEKLSIQCFLKERDEHYKFIVKGKERKNCNEQNVVFESKNINLIKIFFFNSLIKCTKQLNILKKLIIKPYRLSNGKNSNTITKILEAKLVEFEIDRARYHSVDLEGTSIARLFQNAEKIFKQFSIEIHKTITNGKQKMKLRNILKDISNHVSCLFRYFY